MSEDNQIKQKEPLPILSVIEDIKNGRIKACTLSKEMRQQCIEIFVGEGYSISQMAKILDKCDRTIRRDLHEIRERNALTPDIGLAKRLIGELVTYARIHRDHLMRMARIQTASVAEKSQAEFFAFKVSTELISKLQTLGFLPQKPQEIIADFSHHIITDDEKSFGELKKQIIEIERIAKERGELTPEMTRELEQLKKRIEKADIQNKVVEISATKPKEDKNE